MSDLLPLPPDEDLEIPTSRLVQVPLLRAHAAALFPVLADPRLHEFTGGSPPESEELLADRYARLESRRSPDGTELWLNWVLRLREGNEAIGYTQATVRSTHAEVAWVVGYPWQHHGYASEAAAALVEWLGRAGLPEIRACVNPAHIASARVARKAGLHPSDAVIDGEVVWIRQPEPIPPQED